MLRRSKLIEWPEHLYPWPTDLKRFVAVCHKLAAAIDSYDRELGDRLQTDPFTSRQQESLKRVCRACWRVTRPEFFDDDNDTDTEGWPRFFVDDLFEEKPQLRAPAEEAKNIFLLERRLEECFGVVNAFIESFAEVAAGDRETFKAFSGIRWWSPPPDRRLVCFVYEPDKAERIAALSDVRVLAAGIIRRLEAGESFEHVRDLGQKELLALAEQCQELLPEAHVDNVCGNAAFFGRLVILVERRRQSKVPPADLAEYHRWIDVELSERQSWEPFGGIDDKGTLEECVEIIERVFLPWGLKWLRTRNKVERIARLTLVKPTRARFWKKYLKLWKEFGANPPAAAGRSFAEFCRDGGLQAIESRLPASSETEGEIAATKAPDKPWLPPADIAKQIGQPADAVKKKLARWRQKNLGSNGWREVADRGPRESQFLYRLDVVRSLFEPSSASRERPAK